jgi:hypothetical protein
MQTTSSPLTSETYIRKIKRGFYIRKNAESKPNPTERHETYKMLKGTACQLPKAFYLQPN